MDALLVAICAVVGLAVGSFLNVVIWRVPRKESIMRPGSHCPVCDSPIRPVDNIPLFSWIVRRGRCRDCDATISVRYPLVELLTAVLFAGMGARFGWSWALPAYLVFAAALVALSAIDLEHYILPNRIVYPLAGVMLVLLAVAALGDGDGTPWVRALEAAVIAYAFLFVLHFIAPRGMGFGDVKLAFSLGAALGWLGWDELSLGLFLGFLYGSLIGILLIATRLRSRKDAVPFGPFLAAGALTAVLFGAPTLFH